MKLSSCDVKSLMNIREMKYILYCDEKVFIGMDISQYDKNERPFDDEHLLLQ